MSNAGGRAAVADEGGAEAKNAAARLLEKLRRERLVEKEEPSSLATSTRGGTSATGTRADAESA